MGGGRETASATIRRLLPADAAEYRALRLEGLRSHPDAFGSSWEEESPNPPGWFAQRLEDSTVFGAFDRDGRLLGAAGFFIPERAKARHKGVLWGMFVRPEGRGRGLGRALVERVIAHAAPQVEELLLTVVATNDAAVRLYRAAGFKEYGVEPRALKSAGRYYDELLMSREVPSPVRE